MDFKNLAKVEYSDQLILTTEQLAEFYECKVQQIQQNFLKNKDRFEIGKHYFKLEGEELKTFKSYFDKIELPIDESKSLVTKIELPIDKSKSLVTKIELPVNKSKSLVTKIELPINKFAPSLYLWTKKGAARHAKMLSTEKAWEVFELLEDNYFNSKEKTKSEVENENAVATKNQPLLKSTIADFSLKDAASMMKTMEKEFGVKHGMAMARALSVVERLNEIELPEIKELIPPAEYEIGYLTPTQIGKIIGKSAQYVNKKLVELGLQEKDGRGGYILTDKGKHYGEAIPFERNGHAGYQIKLLPEVLPLFS